VYLEIPARARLEAGGAKKLAILLSSHGHQITPQAIPQWKKIPAERRTWEARKRRDEAHRLPLRLAARGRGGGPRLSTRWDIHGPTVDVGEPFQAALRDRPPR
jgi:hypothetical protein